MKKTYQQPATDIVTVSTTIPLTTSPGTPSATIDPDADPVGPGEIESRRSYNIWGDDE